MCLLWYNNFVKNNTEINYTPKQGRFPVFISDLLEISDPVIAFDHVMEAIGVQKYLKGKVKSTGRLGYNPVNLLKTVLFAFRDKGYASATLSTNILKTALKIYSRISTSISSSRITLTWIICTSTARNLKRTPISTLLYGKRQRRNTDMLCLPR